MAITSARSFDLCNIRAALVERFLGLTPKYLVGWRPLCSQHWWHETEATQTAGWKQASPKAQGQSIAWPAELESHWWDLALPRFFLCFGNYSDRAHQQTSWRPTSRSFWEQKNMRTCCPRILLTNALPWHQKTMWGDATYARTWK